MAMDMAAPTPPPSPSDKRYEYFAFISYKHEDVRAARTLQHRLETYRIPSIILKEAPHLPRNIRPVFRDQTDISAGPLLENLRKELEDSRYLIVICSPAAAKSPWVNREIEHFIAMGRGDRIIPFVVAGEPNAKNPAQECFPAALRGGESEMLGINANELGGEQAVVKVVAKLLGLKFDRLWDRHRRRRRRQTIGRGFVAVSFLFAAAVGGFFTWDYYRTKVAYYADYVEVWGVPRGLGELSLDKVRQRATSWKLDSSRYRLNRASYVNGSGAVRASADSEDADRPVDRTFHYRDRASENRDDHNALDFTIEYSPTGKERRR
jgi:hypothetical protein